jgi:hypothetical protein
MCSGLQILVNQGFENRGIVRLPLRPEGVSMRHRQDVAPISRLQIDQPNNSRTGLPPSVIGTGLSPAASSFVVSMPMA